MPKLDKANLILGGLSLLVALFILGIWIPLDVASGLIEKVRRQVTVGDALAPSVAAAMLLLGSLFVIFEGSERSRSLSRENVFFLLILLGLAAISLAIMRWLGPAIAFFLTDEGYRPLRDTAPWKYLSFMVGGTVLVSGLIALVDRRISLKGLLIGFAAVLVLILIYDLPFDDLLLPPNGDV